MMNEMKKSKVLFESAQKLIPGGVNSPVRACRAVNRDPIFIDSADGSVIRDADGNDYIDYVGSWGPMILGNNNPAIHDAVVSATSKGLSFGAATEAEVEMAQLLSALIPSLEMVRLVNSGTEATMSALRVARGFTGRDKIIKFEGCYHGHSSELLVKAGSGLLNGSSPDSAGVPAGCAADTLVAAYNNIESVEKLFADNKGEIAAVIVEPIAANMGLILPASGFLSGLREICDTEGALLIFDEVISGFRVALGGAQELYGIKPDLSTFGKIIGGGMPVGAYGGRRDIMEIVAPLGPVYQAGTLSGNPIAMAAGITQLTQLRDHPEIYLHLDELGERLFGGLADIIRQKGAACTVNRVGSLGSLFFTSGPVTDFQSAKRSDTDRFAEYYTHMLERGIWLAPAQFEAVFISAAHTEDDIDRTLKAAETFF